MHSYNDSGFNNTAEIKVFIRTLYEGRGSIEENYHLYYLLWGGNHSRAFPSNCFIFMNIHFYILQKKGNFLQMYDIFIKNIYKLWKILYRIEKTKKHNFFLFMFTTKNSKILWGENKRMSLMKQK